MSPFVRVLAGITFLVLIIFFITGIILALIKHPSVQITPPQDIGEWFQAIFEAIIGFFIVLGGLFVLGKIAITGNLNLFSFKKK